MKSYKPIYILLDPNLVRDIDSFQEQDKTRSTLIREAVERHVDYLKGNSGRPSRWSV
jgi:metal-responsive CopG/Arc/MetJ family transcriptional regulator